ncbi:MAG TPA: SDR family NAD(P)-dependent oxidoreductase [Candidatus Angelobacter sp.]|nr:SDR family NAD(P)-dependent oxidoreductase [Candidatus Angelobacter sp.]
MRRRNKFILGGIATGMVAAGAAVGLGTAYAGREIFKRLREGRLPGLESLGFEGEDLRGQTVFITGSSRGLGLALAEEFARQGCKLVLCARDEQELSRAREHVSRLGAEVRTVACDVANQKEIERGIDEARREFGRIDVLVNNAGIIAVGPILTQKLEDFKEAMDVMFWGAVYPTLAVLPEMVERGSGRIVNITSIGGKVSVPHLVPYGCAKFAAVGFSEGLYAELKKYGIHVLTVVPGLMRTGSHLNAQFKGKHQKEYGWFALSATNPLFSISVERAARQIVHATRRNQPELAISWQAELLARAHGAAPELTLRALALVNHLLPGAEGASSEKKPGRESRSSLTRSPLTALGERAARRYNQTGETA